MKQKLLALAALSALHTSAFAALPAGVETAISGAGADVVTAIGAMIVVGVAIWAINRVRRLFP